VDAASVTDAQVPTDASSAIQYPPQGTAGPNLLDRHRTDYPVGFDCSLRVILPKAARLRVVMTGNNGPGAHIWGITQVVAGWEDSVVSSTAMTFAQAFVATTQGDHDRLISSPDDGGVVQVDVFENGASTPTWSKTVTFALETANADASVGDGGAMDGGTPSWSHGDVVECTSDDDCIASESCVFVRDHGMDVDHQLCFPRADLASDGESCMQRTESQGAWGSFDVDLCAYPTICAAEVIGHGIEVGNVTLDETKRYCRPTCTQSDTTGCGEGVCVYANRNLDPWVGACFPSDDCDFSGGCPVGKQCGLVVDMTFSRTVPRCLVPNGKNKGQGAVCVQMEDCAGASSCWGTPGTKPSTWQYPDFYCHALCDLGDPSPPCNCVAPDDGTLSMRTLAVSIGLCL
jgi:hypothetical protein